jgi:O-antigen/teichoic acid export membrane protein
MTVSPSGASHTRRIFSEQVGQALYVATGFFDKLIVTALIFRVWEVKTFEAWSACLAFAAICSLFEFGFNIYFSNRIMFETEQGRQADLSRTYALGNTLFGLCGLVSFIAMTAAALILAPGGARAGGAATIAAIILSAVGSAKLAMNATNALYRANRQYARYTLIQSVSEVGRIGLMVIAVLLGGGLVAAALFSSLAVIAIAVVFVLFDTRRRFYPHGHSFAVPKLAEMGDVMSMSTAYFAQMLPVVLWTSLPVLILQKMTLAAGLLASFILIRTLSNLARSPLQSFGVVFGQECGRRIAVADLPGALMVLKRGTRLFAAVSGLASGVLVAGGAQVIKLWTGNPAMFQAPLMAVAIAPMAIASASILTHNVLVASNAPYSAAAGRWLQMAVTVAVYLFAPIAQPPLRMMAALAAGEVLGYAPLAYLGMARLIPGAGVGYHLQSLLLTLFSLALGGAATELSFWLIGDRTGLQLIASLLLTSLLCAAVVPFAGISLEGRAQLWRHVFLPIVRRTGLVS